MTAFKLGKLFVFGRVYNRPGKIVKKMRSTPVCSLFYFILKSIHLFENLLLKVW